MKIDITVEIPLLPEAWEGTPDDLLQFFKESATFEFDGTFPTGQVGGARPTSDAGIFYGDNAIEKFRNGAYRPISDVPVGAFFPWASSSGTPPEFYLFCNGASVLRADYPFLFDVIGTTWGTPVDGTTFYLPDIKGRVVYGAGIGDYEAQGITGTIQERVTGTKVGTSWLRKLALYLNAPTSAMTKVLVNSIEQPATNQWHDTTQPGVVAPYIIRYK